VLHVPHTSISTSLLPLFPVTGSVYICDPDMVDQFSEFSEKTFPHLSHMRTLLMVIDILFTVLTYECVSYFSVPSEFMSSGIDGSLCTECINIFELDDKIDSIPGIFCTQHPAFSCR
jgi:hypothetical protein